MYFINQLRDQNRLQAYEASLAPFAKFVDECARLVVSACEVAQKKTFPEHKYHHATIILLMRHVAEAVDGVSLLVAKGSVENCGPLLRSAFEGLAGILYILKTDTERRALAYQVGHIYKKIKLYRKFIATDDVGRNLRAELKDDPLVSFFEKPQVGWQKMIDNLKNTFTKPEYAPIEAEWDRVKKGKKGTGTKDPNWYALFGGPSDLRGVSLQIGKASFYEILYRHWSDFAHAGGAFSNIGKGSSIGVTIKPVRCPEGIEQACTFAYQICVETVAECLKAMASDEWPAFQQRIVKELRQRAGELATKKLFKINWETRPSSPA
jgi:hypothetical protein